MTQVLVVEDEPNIRELVCLHLKHEGYECEALADGSAALKRSESKRFDLMVLDLMIPGLDGVSLCRAIRNGRLNRDVPILMLTARRDETDKVVGLESGADDYLTKPFGVRELVARARALLRRPRQPAPPEASTPDLEVGPTSTVGPSFPGSPKRGEREGGSSGADGRDTVRVHGLVIDVPKRRVTVNGGDVELTDQEFRLLHLLATHPGIVFSREALVSKIWRGETFVTVRSVDTLVKRLRRRIEGDAANPKYLLTVWGVGYKFADVA
jgi:DNA-binding response OmpR family regulator